MIKMDELRWTNSVILLTNSCLSTKTIWVDNGLPWITTPPKRKEWEPEDGMIGAL